MAIRPEFRWVLLAVGIVAVLLTISALALTRPDVVWADGKPHCPHCRVAVEPFSIRCRECREEYSWGVAPDADSPISPWSLSVLEDQHLQARVAAMGRERAADRVAKETGLSREGALAYLEKVGLGRCGWCGGTGRDLARPTEAAVRCPACLGRGSCIACDGDRRIRVGESGSARDFRRYRASMLDLSARVPEEILRAEARELGEEFLLKWHGTEEATQIWFWPQWTATPPGWARAHSPRVVEVCRDRLDDVLEVLATDP